MYQIETSQREVVLPIVSAQSIGDDPETLYAAIWRERWMILAPLVILLTFTAFCYVLPIDLICSRPFFLSPFHGWLGDRWFVEDLCYAASPLPGIVMGIGAILVLVVSRWSKEIAARKAAAGFLLCALLAGPLLLVNCVVKPTVSRPRPNQLVVFGGIRAENYNYVAPLQLSTADGRSFPSGHASMGFIWMAPAFLYWRSKPRVASLWIAVGLLYGGTIGFFRIAVGAHFLSDIVWACGIVYFSGLALYLCLGGWRTDAFQNQPANKVNEITAASEAAVQGLQPEAQAA